MNKTGLEKELRKMEKADEFMRKADKKFSYWYDKKEACLDRIRGFLDKQDEDGPFVFAGYVFKKDRRLFGKWDISKEKNLG